jgi:hypothetical protein
MHLARRGGERAGPAGDKVRDIDDRDRLAHGFSALTCLRGKGDGIMAQIAARLLRNLGFLIEAGGEPLEPIGERHQLLAAARLKPHFLGDAPEPLGDLAEMRHPILRKVLGHRHRLPPSALRYKRQRDAAVRPRNRDVRRVHAGTPVISSGSLAARALSGVTLLC